MKRAAAALVAALLVLPLATAEEPLPDPVSAEEWAARDFEGRWALMARDGNLARGILTLEWSTFLQRRGEWNLLEWAAIATDRSPAIQMLVDAGHANWMRVAVWALGNRDSHSFESTAKDLEARPALVRGWFQLHPRALSRHARPLLEKLEQAGGPVELTGARLLDPPYVPERLLAALTPPPDVREFGDRKRAEPGVTYLHQVERALAIWARSPLDEDEAWQARVAALLAHPSQAVRKAAALACSLEPPGPGLRRALLGVLDDPSSSPDARSAALVTLSLWATPDVRLRLIDVALDPSHPSFTAAASAGADQDRGFLLRAWKGLDADPPSSAAAAFLREQQTRLEQRLAAEDGEQRARAVGSMLGLAAYADLVDWPRAAALLFFTIERLGEEARREPKVREQLEALREDPGASTYGVAPEQAGEVGLRARALARRALALAYAPRR